MIRRCCLPLIWSIAGAAVGAPDNSDNQSIQRALSGEYQYRTIKDRTPRGWERFQLFVHPDGTRTLMMWHNLAARDAQFSVVLRVAEDFRPLEAFLSYWVANGFKGNQHDSGDGRSATRLQSGSRRSRDSIGSGRRRFSRSGRTRFPVTVGMCRRSHLRMGNRQR